MSVLGTAKSILIFSRDYAAENRHINTANLALMGIWCLLAYFLLWGCVHHLFLDGRVTSCLGENDLERVGDLATGLLFIWMGMGERATGKSITVVPIHMAYSTLKKKNPCSSLLSHLEHGQIIYKRLLREGWRSELIALLFCIPPLLKGVKEII